MATKRAIVRNYNKDLSFYFQQQQCGMHIGIIQHIIVLFATVFMSLNLYFLYSINSIE